MPPDAPEQDSSPDGAWTARRRRWARKLGRLRLGVEPLAVQLARYRRVTWGLTAVCSGIGLLFLALFAAFGRPGVGLILAAILLGPIVALAWLDYARLSWRAAAYERERLEFEGKSAAIPEV